MLRPRGLTALLLAVFLGALGVAAWATLFWNLQHGGTVGYGSSLALDASDRPHISYRGYTTLRHAAWNGTSWDTQAVNSSGDGTYTSLAFDSRGYPHIGYYQYPLQDLKYASWSGAGWDRQTVDAAGSVGDGHGRGTHDRARRDGTRG